MLSGGSTVFKGFDKRLKKDLTYYTKKRLEEASRHAHLKPKPIDVEVIRHDMQKYAVWFGGSMISQTPDFMRVMKTKADYEEYGPSIMRFNEAFRSSVR